MPARADQRRACSVIARLLRSVDFERVLRTRSRASSAHFALHHVPERPSVPARRLSKSVKEADRAAIRTELSTGETLLVKPLVDDLTQIKPKLGPERPETGPDVVSAEVPVQGVWLGAVVPKRHAKRAVTRTLLKRQIRSVAGIQADRLGAGLWVVRLRAPFDAKVFVSAASEALKRAARTELDGLFDAASRRSAGR